MHMHQCGPQCIYTFWKHAAAAMQTVAHLHGMEAGSSHRPLRLNFMLVIIIWFDIIIITSSCLRSLRISISKIYMTLVCTRWHGEDKKYIYMDPCCVHSWQHAWSLCLLSRCWQIMSLWAPTPRPGARAACRHQTLFFFVKILEF